VDDVELGLVVEFPPRIDEGLPRSPEIAEQAPFYGDGFFADNTLWPTSHIQCMVGILPRAFAHYGHGDPDRAIVGLGGQVFMRTGPRAGRPDARVPEG
jgi:hypothetical protein